MITMTFGRAWAAPAWSTPAGGAPVPASTSAPVRAEAAKAAMSSRLDDRLERLAVALPLMRIPATVTRESWRESCLRKMGTGARLADPP
jgi:hypothetical protein